MRVLVAMIAVTVIAEPRAEACDPQAAEVCDRIDNDCDDVIDENLAFGQCGHCCNTSGPNTGHYDASGSCSALVAIVIEDSTNCDGLDNDCDTFVDEGTANIYARCDVGVGECKRKANYICNATNDGVVCSETVGFPAAPSETCDGKDNDCDSFFDEELGGAPCDGPDADDCIEGVLVCAGNQIECNDATDDTIGLCVDAGVDAGVDAPPAGVDGGDGIDAPPAAFVNPYENHGCSSDGAGGGIAIVVISLGCMLIGRPRRGSRRRPGA
jgi:hypothetical protein